MVSIKESNLTALIVVGNFNLVKQIESIIHLHDINTIAALSLEGAKKILSDNHIELVFSTVDLPDGDIEELATFLSSRKELSIRLYKVELTKSTERAKVLYHQEKFQFVDSKNVYEFHREAIGERLRLVLSEIPL